MGYTDYYDEMMNSLKKAYETKAENIRGATAGRIREGAADITAQASQMGIANSPLTSALLAKNRGLMTQAQNQALSDLAAQQAQQEATIQQEAAKAQMQEDLANKQMFMNLLGGLGGTLGSTLKFLFPGGVNDFTKALSDFYKTLTGTPTNYKNTNNIKSPPGGLPA
jgi:hypothetical protein